MPHNIVYRPRLIDSLITNDRLNSYANVFQHTNDAELVGAYLWNGHACSALYPLLGAVEIALRNAVDHALTNHLGRFWWRIPTLHFKSFGNNQVPFSVQAIRDNFSSAATVVVKEKKNRYGINSCTPSHAEIVAKTEFSTWEFIFAKDFLGPGLIWPTCLGSVLTGSWPSTSARTTLSHTRDLVKTVRDFRNRVFHHEPAWKKFGVSTERDAIDHLHEKIGKIEELLALVSPEKFKLLEKNRLIANAYRACSISELHRYQRKASNVNIKSMGKLATAVKDGLLLDRNTEVTIFTKGKISFLISPL